MRQTGAHMQAKHKESSQGGLAVNLIECLGILTVKVIRLRPNHEAQNVPYNYFIMIFSLKLI